MHSDNSGLLCVAVVTSETVRSTIVAEWFMARRCMSGAHAGLDRVVHVATGSNTQVPLQSASMYSNALSINVLPNVQASFVTITASVLSML